MADKKTDSLPNGCPSDGGNEGEAAAPPIGGKIGQFGARKLPEGSLKSVAPEIRDETGSSNDVVEEAVGKSNAKIDPTVSSIDSNESRPKPPPPTTPTTKTSRTKTPEPRSRSEEAETSSEVAKGAGKIEASNGAKTGAPTVSEKDEKKDDNAAGGTEKTMGESSRSEKAVAEVEVATTPGSTGEETPTTLSKSSSKGKTATSSRVEDEVETAEGDSAVSKKVEESGSATRDVGEEEKAVDRQADKVVDVVGDGGDCGRAKFSPDSGKANKSERDQPENDDVEEEGGEEGGGEEEPEEVANEEGEEVGDEEDDEEDEDEDEEDEDENENENEQLELGIVGPPTAVSELINEEELRCSESVLPTESRGGGADGSVQDHVAEWVQNSANNKLNEELAIDDEENDNENENENDNDNDNDNDDETDNLRQRGINPAGNSRRDKNADTNPESNEKNIETSATRKSKRVVSNIIKRSIKCLNKMHAMDVSGVGKGSEKVLKKAEKMMDKQQQQQQQQQQQHIETTEVKMGKEQRRISVEIEEAGGQRNHRDVRNHHSQPNHRRNGGGDHREVGDIGLREYGVKKEPTSEPETDPELERDVVPELRKRGRVSADIPKNLKPKREIKKRRSTDDIQASNGSSKRACLEQREELICSIVGGEKVTTEELTVRAEQLRAELQALDQLARAKEKEWNEILSMRKLKEEAYLRIERRRQVVGFMEGNGQLNVISPAVVPPGNITIEQEQWDNAKEKSNSTEATMSDKSTTRPQATSKQSENGQKESLDGQNSENRQIGEGRQGPMVDVRTIIADYRLRHPETVPRRSRRMRNSVNVGLGAGGAVVETGHVGADSRPSSTDSCKSSSNPTDPSNSMSFKDVLVQFAKLSQQQGEAVKTPQNYPDVTLHPVLPSPAAPQTAAIQPSGSLLHGILTKSQSPRPTTFSPTLARLLTAPERERGNPIATSTPQQATATQHLLQAYQGTNPVSISDLLSSSKARTEITITPVVSTPTVQSHSNNLIHVEDVEEETTVIEERSRSSNARDDSPPRCQGCQDRAAQFVCAGCGNQWYCSRECQVSAWDEHSEVCSG